MARVRKIRPGHRICQLLIAAGEKGCSRVELEEFMRNDDMLKNTVNKLSGYVRDIEWYDGGQYEMIMDGRKAIRWVLKNPEIFNPTTGQCWTEEEIAAHNATSHLNDDEYAHLIIDPEYVDIEQDGNVEYDVDLMRKPSNKFFSAKKNAEKMEINLKSIGA